MPSDSELLRLYAHERCERAFAELVRTHIDLVYSAAIRRVGGDPHAAAEVTQEVFTSMARHAADLSRHPVLSAWLHTCTRNAVFNLRRRERRRELQKQQVYAMQDQPDSETRSLAWEEIRGVLDEALDTLSENDRQAIILRFFEEQSYPVMGEKLGLREATVRRRVDRALEKLRLRLQQKGIASTAAVLSGALSTHSVLGAPAGLAGVVAATIAATPFLVPPPLIGLLHFMSVTKLTTIVAGLVIIVGGVVFLMPRSSEPEVLAIPAATAQPVVTLLERETPLQEKLAGVVKDYHDNGGGVSSATAEAEAKIAALRDVLARLPEQGIPELKLATNADWHLAVEGALETAEDYRRALGKLRARAESQLAKRVQPALREYLQSNGGVFPTNTQELQLFVGGEVNREMLGRYTIVPASEIKNVRMGGEWAITQRELIDSDYDSHSVIGPNGFGATTYTVSKQREGAKIMPAIRAYKAAHGANPADILQALPYAVTPEEKAIIEKWSRRAKVEP